MRESEDTDQAGPFIDHKETPFHEHVKNRWPRCCEPPRINAIAGFPASASKDSASKASCGKTSCCGAGKGRCCTDKSDGRTQENDQACSTPPSLPPFGQESELIFS